MSFGHSACFEAHQQAFRQMPGVVFPTLRADLHSKNIGRYLSVLRYLTAKSFFLHIFHRQTDVLLEASTSSYDPNQTEIALRNLFNDTLMAQRVAKKDLSTRFYIRIADTLRISTLIADFRCGFHRLPSCGGSRVCLYITIYYP